MLFCVSPPIRLINSSSNFVPNAIHELGLPYRTRLKPRLAGCRIWPLSSMHDVVLLNLEEPPISFPVCRLFFMSFLYFHFYLFFLLPCPSSFPTFPSLPYNLLHKDDLSYCPDLWALRFSSIFELARMKLARNISTTSVGQKILQSDEGISSRRLREPFQAPTAAPLLPFSIENGNCQS